MVYCVGLTGNIASGKTTAAEMFTSLGVEVISADAISREITRPDEAAYHEIVGHFGAEVLQKDASINRKKLRDIIFSMPNERIWLETLLHPLIRKKIEAKAYASSSPYCLVEIPLLLDKTGYPYLNKILLIIAPLQAQIDRVMKRDNCTREHALSILAVQPDLGVRLLNADDVLYNNDGQVELKEKIHILHEKYLQEASLL